MKSHASSLLEVAICVYKDAIAKCTAVNFDARDVDTLTSRLEHEGLSFLTITLPSLGADFERCLDRGRVEPCDFRAFKKVGRIPAFLQGIFALVFDQTGELLHEPSIEAIEGIRQLAYTFKKLEVDCTPARVSAALDGYMQCERDLEDPIDPDDEDYFRRVSRVIWDDMFRDSILENAIPKHGPGATQEKLSGNRKYLWRRWHKRLEPYFPFLGWAGYQISSYGTKEFERVTFVEEADEKPVRVITVPKTLKSPRIIAIEPVCMQYTQQQLASAIVKSIEKSVIAGGHVNFHDQSVNRSMALTHSKTGRFATLDLSAASDRVPRDLALDMFSDIAVRGAVDACRSRRAKLPNGIEIALRKFASMGSALCFPVESMYFYTICVAALLKKAALPVTRRNVFNVSRSVYVYGDDIIVPADAAVVVCDHLAKYKCKVNTTKSFWTGKFRESCGMDAYDGEEVTPTYLRQLPPTNKLSTGSIVSWTETSNLMYKRGYWLTSSLLRKKVESIIGVLPVIGERCPGLGVVSFMGSKTFGRMSKRYHAVEVRAWVPVPVYRNDRLDGHGALTKCLLAMETRHGTEIHLQKDHLGRTVLRGAVALKRRWVPPA